MTASELIAALRERGLRVSVTKAGKLRVEPKARLTDADRAHIRDHTAALLAALALESALTEDAVADDAAQARLVVAGEAAFRRRQERYRRDRLAVLDADRVRAMVDAGKFSAQDVAEWREAVDERLARLRVQALLTLGLGRVVRLVEGIDGAYTVCID